MRELKLLQASGKKNSLTISSRSGESYSQKWDYVKENPARAGSLTDPMSGHGKARLNR